MNSPCHDTRAKCIDTAEHNRRQIRHRRWECRCGNRFTSVELVVRDNASFGPRNPRLPISKAEIAAAVAALDLP